MHCQPLGCVAAAVLCLLAACAAQDPQCDGQPDTWPCDDANPSTPVDYCVDGVCIGLCEAPLTLVDGQCIFTCQGQPDGLTCDDNDANTPVDYCEDGVCVGHCEAPLTLVNGTCIFTCDDKPDGTACDDSNTNTPTDVCENGVCVGKCAAPLVFVDNDCVTVCAPISAPALGAVVSCGNAEVCHCMLGLIDIHPDELYCVTDTSACRQYL
jgi:hypothetical protein